MTAEEIVLSIKQTKQPSPELFLQLWDSVLSFVHQKAVARAGPLQRLDDVDDLIQEAWLILGNAVDYYDPSKEKNFLSVLNSYFLPTAFSIALYGKRGTYATKDPSYHAYSLDATLADTDLCQLDILEDPQAEDMFIAIDDESFWSDFRKFLRDALTHLPEKQSLLLKSMYLCENGARSITECWQQKILGDMSRDGYYSIHKNALKSLRKYICGKGKSEADRMGIFDTVRSSDYYAGGLARFKNTHISPVEKIAMKHSTESKRLVSFEDLIKSTAH